LSSFCLVLRQIGLRLSQFGLVTLEVGLVFLDLGILGAELRRIAIEFVLVPGDILLDFRDFFLVFFEVGALGFLPKG